MNNPQLSPADLAQALQERRFETARRIARALLASPEHHTEAIVFQFHAALAGLGDLRAAVDLLTQSSIPLDPGTVARMLAGDFKRLASLDHYRISAEARAGLTADEYKDKYLALSREQETIAEALQSREVEPAIASENEALSTRRVSLRGKITSILGEPVARATVTLGYTPRKSIPAPPREVAGVEYAPCFGEPVTHTILTDSGGNFIFEQVPAVQDFLAVTCEDWALPTRFLRRELALEGDTDLGILTLQDWQSAPPEHIPSPHPDFRKGARKLAETVLHNPFDYDFPRQLLRLTLPEGADSTAPIVIINGIKTPAQVVAGEAAFLVSLPAFSRAWIAIYEGKSEPTASPLALEKGETWKIETGAAAFRIAGDKLNAPIVQVRGEKGTWRGCGRFHLPEGIIIERQGVQVIEEGPVLLQVSVDTVFSNGSTWCVTLTALAGEPVLLVREKSVLFDGASFDFSLREFSGGRGYLHWTPEHGNLHWTTLAAEDRLAACLPESVPWWIPPQGFAYAMSPDRLNETDYVAVFTIRRGEWVDREFSRLAYGPLGEDGKANHELDWPYPEMVGSSISWITARTSADGDAFFRFSFFDGERQWGIVASSLEKNDGDDKQLAAVQHANSSPRLQEFKDWHFDVADDAARPLLYARRDDLPALKKKREHPRFRALWEKIRSGTAPGPARSLAFALEGDAGYAWKRRSELLAGARVRTRMTLLGRDRGDLYSPVGGRPITLHAEEFDLLAASGVFSVTEEREMRAYLVLMAHMFMEHDLMNWTFNSRNANFEADRVEIVGTIGLIFPGHPDSEKFLHHVVERTRLSLKAYCTPGSGKWYENPACYYLHASKCRMALVYHLAKSGRLNVTEIPLLKEFLRWGLLLLTPPQPVSYAVMRDGGEAAYESAAKIRKVPPIGDHASLGAWLPEHYAFIGKLFSTCDPEFGRELMQAWFLSSGDALALRGIAENVPESSPFGNIPLLFSVLEEGDIPGQPALALESRRLEGFGAIFRAGTGTPAEAYVLIKQGPGGYRYHRTEGSFIFFAAGRPLIYDGGEAGETWRHSTLSFYDSHMPLAAGRVERCFVDPQFQFLQAAHPEAIRPGEPVFLNDNCDHRLVAECHRRFRKEPPAVSRSFSFVGGRYLVVHDEFFLDTDIPWHWHLQVVADGMTGAVADGFQFQGRFGVDLEVQFPGQNSATASATRLPTLEHRKSPDECFAMHHLELSNPGAKSCLAVLFPQKHGRSSCLHTEVLKKNGVHVGARISTSGHTDLLWLHRDGCAWSGDGVSFEGTYGALLRHETETTLVLIGCGRITKGDLQLQSDGPHATLRQSGSGLFLRAQGRGTITISHRGKSESFSIKSEVERRII